MIPWLHWKLLARAMKREHVFNKRRLNPRYLSGRYGKGLAVTEVDENGYIVGYAALWDTCLADVFELGSFFVDPSRRRQGLGASLFARCQEILEREGADAVALTTSEVFERIALRAGWEVDGRGDNLLARVLLSEKKTLRSPSAHNLPPLRPVKTLLRSWGSDEILFPKK